MKEDLTKRKLNCEERQFEDVHETLELRKKNSESLSLRLLLL